MTSRCASTVQMREEPESAGIRKWAEMWFKMTAEDGERGGSSDGRWKTVLQTSGCDRKRSDSNMLRLTLSALFVQRWNIISKSDLPREKESLRTKYYRLYSFLMLPFLVKYREPFLTFSRKSCTARLFENLERNVSWCPAFKTQYNLTASVNVVPGVSTVSCICHQTSSSSTFTA